MRPEKNPLDLNNLPEDYTRDIGRQVFEESSSAAGHRKKKSGAKDGKDECGKVYECRFCSLKFCKSQALGGHMNRHRQERETETLNKARQLVFHNDHNLTPQALPHLGCHPITPAGSYHPAGHIGDPFRSVYSPRLFSASSSTIISPPPPQAPQYPYPSPTRLSSYTSQYPPAAAAAAPPPPHMNEYYVGHVLGSSPHSQYPNLNNYMGAAAPGGGGGGGGGESNYTCIGAPVGHGFVAPSSSRGSDMGGSSSGGGRDGSLSNIQQEEGLNWGRQLQQRSLDHPSSINRFQDGF